MVKQEKWNLNDLKYRNYNKVNDLFFLSVVKVCARVICSGGICPGDKCPGGYMSGGKCPGGTCPVGGGGEGGGLCPRTSINMSFKVSHLLHSLVCELIPLCIRYWSMPSSYRSKLQGEPCFPGN